MNEQEKMHVRCKQCDNFISYRYCNNQFHDQEMANQGLKGLVAVLDSLPIMRTA